LIFVKETM